MVKRAKLANVGEETEVDPAQAVETSFEPNDGEGGYGPGAQEAAEADAAQGDAEVTQESNTGEGATDGDTAQDQADQEAAGVNATAKDDEAARKRGYRALLKDVGVTGADYGAGKTSMIRLAEVVTEGAMHDIVSPEHADEIYDKFRAAADAKGTIEDAGLVPDEATMEHAPPVNGDDKSRAQQLSKLRGFIKLGNKFTDDAGDIIRRARNIHLGLLAGDRKTLKPGSTYTWLYGVAAAQLKHATTTKTTHVFTDEEITALMSQPAKEENVKEGADKLLDAIIAAKAAQNGSADRAPVPSDELAAAIDYLQQALAAVDPEKLNEYEAKLAEAADKKAEAEAKRAEAAAAKAAKAAQPKPAKATKAERQATLKPAAKKAA
jgi:hypothetical protein